MNNLLPSSYSFKSIIIIEIFPCPAPLTAAIVTFIEYSSDI